MLSSQRVNMRCSIRSGVTVVNCASPPPQGGQGSQPFGLGTFGVALGVIFGRGLGAISGSLRLLELWVCPFAFLRVVGQRLLRLLVHVSLYSLFAIAAGDLLDEINDPAPQVGILDPLRFD